MQAKRFSPQEIKILRKITRYLGAVGTVNENPGKGRWKFYKEVVHYVQDHYALNIIRITKSRRMRLVGMYYVRRNVKLVHYIGRNNESKRPLCYIRNIKTVIKK